MSSIILWFVLSACLVSKLVVGDWVQIPQIENSKQQRTDFTDFILTTTTETVSPIFVNDSLFSTVTPNLTSEKSDYEQDEEEEEEEDYDDSDAREGSSNFLPFISMVQDSLLKTENKNIRNKLSFLRNLRDNLLINIEERMRALWPIPEKTETREYKDEHYHMDFPSNEGALMTIGFLTFAVFLIKLVLKLINALKTKYSMYNNGSNSATTTTYIGRRKRSLDEGTQILQLIEEYSFR